MVKVHLFPNAVPKSTLFFCREKKRRKLFSWIDRVGKFKSESIHFFWKYTFPFSFLYY